MVRDAKGRFAPGNPGGPGRPPMQREGDRLATLREVVSADAWRGVCMRALKQALDGDHKAREWLSRYLLPQMGQDGDSLELPGDAEAGLLALRSDPDYLEFLRERALNDDCSAS